MAIDILSPVTAATPAGAFRLNPRPDTLANMRIGLLDNSKRNSRALLEYVAAAIGRTYPSASLMVRSKEQASKGVSPEMVAELRSGCDLVIAGIGD
jgi:hypothetical protein